MTILTHSDESSGLTVLDDGTKMYWTEGYSDTLIVHPDGRREVVGAFDDHPMRGAMESLDGDMRRMTEAEETEFDLMRAF